MSRLRWAFPLLLCCLCAFADCDSAWFRTSICTFQSENELCMEPGMRPDASVPDMSIPPPDMGPQKPTWVKAVEKVLGNDLKWAGVYGDKYVIFSKRGPLGMTQLSIESYQYNAEKMMMINASCEKCPTMVIDFDFTKDTLLTGKTAFYRFKPDLGGGNGTVTTFMNAFMGQEKYKGNLWPDLPFINAGSETVVFKVNSGDYRYFNQIDGMSKDLKMIAPAVIAIGEIDDLATIKNGIEILAINGREIKTIIHTDSTSFPTELITRIQNAMSAPIPVGAMVDAASIADLDGDGNAEILLASRGSIWALSYMRNTQTAVPWIGALAPVPAGHTIRSILAAEFDGKPGVDLILETDKSVIFYRQIPGM